MSPRNRRQQGQIYEALAEQYLTQQGLLPIQRNFTCRSGEIDLIMQHQQCWVFVEVKFRQHQDYGTAVEAVTYRKQQRIKRAALYWLQQQGLPIEHTEFRFDIVTVEGAAHHITWFSNTFVEG